MGSSTHGDSSLGLDLRTPDMIIGIQIQSSEVAVILLTGDRAVHKHFRPNYAVRLSNAVRSSVWLTRLRVREACINPQTEGERRRRRLGVGK